MPSKVRPWCTWKRIRMSCLVLFLGMETRCNRNDIRLWTCKTVGQLGVMAKRHLKTKFHSSTSKLLSKRCLIMMMPVNSGALSSVTAQTGVMHQTSGSQFLPSKRTTRTRADSSWRIMISSKEWQSVLTPSHGRSAPASLGSSCASKLLRSRNTRDTGAKSWVFSLNINKSTTWTRRRSICSFTTSKTFTSCRS